MLGVHGYRGFMLGVHGYRGACWGCMVIGVHAGCAWL